MHIFNYNKIYLILATLIIVNLFIDFLPKTILLVLGTLFLILSFIAYGAKISEKDNLIHQAALGIFFLFSTIIIIGSVFFYGAFLGKTAVILIIFIIFLKTRGAKIYPIKKRIAEYFKTSRNYLLYLIYLIFSGALFSMLIDFKSADLIKSPWTTLPDFFLPLFFITTIILIFLLNKKSVQLAPAIHFFIFFSIAAFVYSLGYGFDQFNHGAAGKYILEHGTITPKPLQYIGLYSINIFINQITGISIDLLNRFLLPALTVVILPVVYYSLYPILEKQKKSLSIVPFFGIFLFPLSYFIVTTPQGLANLFLICFIFLSLKGYKKIWLPLATLFIHPISGIIAFIYWAILKTKINSPQAESKGYLQKTILFLSVFIIPLAFIILGYKLNGGFSLRFDFFSALKEYYTLLFYGGLKQNYKLWLDFIYLFKYLLLPAIVGISLFTAFKYKKNLSIYPLYIFIILTLSFLLTSAVVDFSYLIGYEQKNYSERIFYISFLFLLPYFIFALQRARGRIINLKILPKIFFIFLFSFLITANLYLTYPRYDTYEDDKSKNITSWMVSAVKTIKKDAGDIDYIVLTDQAVSAAALKLDGFKKYYDTSLGQVFYYPIPTSGPLYQEFLNLVYSDAGVSSIRNARFLTKARRAYVALPSYWENYEKIKEYLKNDMQTLYEDKNIVILK